MKIMMLVVILTTLLTLSATADMIVVKSGNAAIGNIDPFVTVRGAPELGGPGDPGISLRQATVVWDQAWVEPVGDSMWLSIATNTFCLPGWYQFVTHFNMPCEFTTASIQVTCSGDNGVWSYLNGTWYIGQGESYNGFRTITLDNTNAFRVGDNELTFNVLNGGTAEWPNPVGVDFYAEVQYTPVPEPSSLLALGGGLVGGIVLQRRRKI